jgi:hypothetical protein
MKIPMLVEEAKNIFRHLWFMAKLRHATLCSAAIKMISCLVDEKD